MAADRVPVTVTLWIDPTPRGAYAALSVRWPSGSTEPWLPEKFAYVGVEPPTLWEDPTGAGMTREQAEAYCRHYEGQTFSESARNVPACAAALALVAVLRKALDRG